MLCWAVAAEVLCSASVVLFFRCCYACESSRLARSLFGGMSSGEHVLWNLFFFIIIIFLLDSTE